MHNGLINDIRNIHCITVTSAYESQQCSQNIRVFTQPLKNRFWQKSESDQFTINLSTCYIGFCFKTKTIRFFRNT
ncbi:Uncharacterised protein [Salmonella enterica subsp. enterica serovar Typhi]|nr:Uncharacterised protein [Salmonella enterica subsp. enterica serovar Typhi]